MRPLKLKRNLSRGSLKWIETSSADRYASAYLQLKESTWHTSLLITDVTLQISLMTCNDNGGIAGQCSSIENNMESNSGFTFYNV